MNEIKNKLEGYKMAFSNFISWHNKLLKISKEHEYSRRKIYELVIFM